jgi:hypothetical protein
VAESGRRPDLGIRRCAQAFPERRLLSPNGHTSRNDHAGLRMRVEVTAPCGVMPDGIAGPAREKCPHSEPCGNRKHQPDEQRGQKRRVVGMAARVVNEEPVACRRKTAQAKERTGMRHLVRTAQRRHENIPKRQAQTLASDGHRISRRRRHGSRKSMTRPVSRKGIPMLNKPATPKRTRPTVRMV